MLVSMTGYGSGTAVRNGIAITAEARSVNNRFFEFSTRLPRRYQTRESELKELVRLKVSRGKITLAVTRELPDSSAPTVQVNVEAARAYAALLRDLAAAVGLPDTVTLDTLMRSSELFLVDPDAQGDDSEWEALREAVDGAVSALAAMRRDEGRVLTDDLRMRVGRLEAAVDRVESLSAGRVERERARLRERIAHLLPPEQTDPGRLEMEIAVLADKLDVTEELVRFRSHVSFFLSALDAEESEGRKLSFLLQEMNREANTIASKAYEAEIAHIVVGMKEELERIREQIQNIE